MKLNKNKVNKQKVGLEQLGEVCIDCCDFIGYLDVECGHCPISKLKEKLIIRNAKNI